MRFLVIGCGSIGKRHIGNLLKLGVGEILALDVRADRRGEVESQFGVKTLGDLEDAWERAPDVALITAPTSSHVSLALQAAEHGCHLFVEKPLTDRFDEGLDRLLATVQKRKLVTLVGCNMRFHHGPATVKRLLEAENIGRVVAVLLEMGQYLPDWHPAEDYRLGYSASTAQGGGIILDAIHELDYARWMFGEVRELVCFGGKRSSLEIDTEDCADILLGFRSGLWAHVHLDYVERSHTRRCKVIGEEGTILWDESEGDVRVFSPADRRWRAIPVPSGYDDNAMYVDELRHFLRCLEGEEKSAQDLAEARRVTAIALAAKESMIRRQPVTLS